MSLDPTRNKHQGDAESREAWRTVKEHAAASRVEVLAQISASGAHGLTCEEAAAAHGLTSYRLSGRFTELKARGLIEKCGLRKTETFHNAKAYRITPKGADVLNRQLQLFP